MIILVLYRTGYGGYFLGAGGTWNLNEVKDPNVEIVASGVFVGFIIYTAVSLVSYCFATGEHKKYVYMITNRNGPKMPSYGTPDHIDGLYTNFNRFSFVFFSTFVDIMMNTVGIFMWLAVGAVALHYWHGYLSEQRFIYASAERQVNFIDLFNFSCWNERFYRIFRLVWLWDRYASYKVLYISWIRFWLQYITSKRKWLANRIFF